MGLDIRLPIGLLFTVIGLVLVGYGLLGSQAVYVRSLGYNVNLIWGAVLFVFGLLNLRYGRRGTSSVRLAQEDAAGPERSAPPEHGVEDASLPGQPPASGH